MRLGTYLDMAQPHSLAGLIAHTPTSAETDPSSQIAHWLFAFDAAGIATFRTLALLATHPVHATRVRQQLAGRDLAHPQDLPYLRACMLESVRLWPTTLAVIRDSTTETTWNGRVLPAKATLVILSSFFHRDEQTMSYANAFAPEIWLDGRSRDNQSLIPFSAGPAECAGRNLVLFLASTMLAVLLQGQGYRLTSRSRINPRLSLPCSLNHFALRFAVAR